MKTVQVEIVPVAEMQSELARIIQMADDEELRANFSAFLTAPLVSDSQKKAAYEEIRNALHFPSRDKPDVMRAWVRVDHAAKVSWNGHYHSRRDGLANYGLTKSLRTKS